VGDEGPNGDGSGDTNGYFPRDKVVSQWVTDLSMIITWRRV